MKLRVLNHVKIWGWIPVGVAFTDAVVSLYPVNDEGMSPSLNPGSPLSKDVLLMDNLSIRLFRYRRGDVVLFRSPDDPNKLLLRRIIGLEGDWITDISTSGMFAVPKGTCWVEGDNPKCLEDSKNKFGPIPLALLKSRAFFRVFPFARFDNIPPNHKAYSKRLLTSQYFTAEDSFRRENR